MNNEIQTWFLIVSLVLPRLSLLIAYCAGQIPYNTTPYIVDVLMSIFLPRILVLLYIYGNQGFSTWFWIHGVVATIVYAWYALRSKSKSKSE